jgi:hypothetical protein
MKRWLYYMPRGNCTKLGVQLSVSQECQARICAVIQQRQKETMHGMTIETNNHLNQNHRTKLPLMDIPARRQT